MGTLFVDSIEKSIPKKRRGFDKRDSALASFVDQVAESLLNKLDWSVIKCVVIASMGV